MDLNLLQRQSEFAWEIPPPRRDARAGHHLRERAADARHGRQGPRAGGERRHAAGIVQASYAMPDAHWGYGFPIGGVAAFDADAGGVVSAGGVGFDISCGVRTPAHRPDCDTLMPMTARTRRRAVASRCPRASAAPDAIRLGTKEMDAMLAGGARWAVGTGLRRRKPTSSASRSTAQMRGARPDCVSATRAKRQRDEMGTLGSGNHYLEVQRVAQIFDSDGRRGIRPARGRRGASASTAARAASATRSAPSS